MPRIHTHYDNLKVARDAPLEVIRAAYKALSNKYHPDKNPGDAAEAARIMSIINTSYEVLCDPVRRREHDAWIAANESSLQRPPEKEVAPSRADDKTESNQNNSSRKTAYKKANFYPKTNTPSGGDLFGLGLTLVIVIAIFSYFSKDGTTSGAASNESNQVTEAHVADKNKKVLTWTEYSKTEYFQSLNLKDRIDARERYFYALAPPNATPDDLQSAWAKFKADTDPDIGLPGQSVPERQKAAQNGQPWPQKADYAKGYKRLHMSGLSSVTVDNTQNDSDVFVKLVYLEGNKLKPVRVFYIPAHGRFTAGKVNPGTYDIRYQDLNTGEFARTDPFRLEEIQRSNGTQFSEITMTLYKVMNGNMDTHRISESEF